MIEKSLSNIVSPSCKFKIFFCKKCNDKIECNKEIKCDDCQQVFHRECMAMNSTDDPSELVHFCKSCSYDKRICPNKNDLTSKIGLKSPKNGVIRELRSRTISNDIPTASHIPVKVNSKSQSKQKKQQEEPCEATSTASKSSPIAIEAKMIAIEKRMADLESKSRVCKCEDQINAVERITVLERTNSVQSAQIDGIKEDINVAIQALRSCEALFDACLSRYHEMQSQLDEMAQNLNDDIPKRFNNIEELNEILARAVYDAKCAFKLHNRTIKTHFNLHEDYCNGIMNKFDAHFVVPETETTQSNSSTEASKNNRIGIDKRAEIESQNNKIHSYDGDDKRVKNENCTKTTHSGHAMHIVDPTDRLSTPTPTPAPASTRTSAHSDRNHSKQNQLQNNAAKKSEGERETVHTAQQPGTQTEQPSKHNTTSNGAAKKKNEKEEGEVHTTQQAITQAEHANKLIAAKKPSIEMKTMKFKNVVDRKRIIVQVNDAQNFGNVSKIREIINDSVQRFQCQNGQKNDTNAFNLHTLRVRYVPITNDVKKCTLIIAFERKIHLVEFEHFLNGFFSQFIETTGNG